MQGRVLVIALVLPAILFLLARPGSQVAAVYVARAKADLDRREYDDAITWRNRALQLNPESAAAYLNRAIAWLEKGDDDKAVADFKQALAITPDDWEILNNLGIQCWKMAQKEEMKAAAAESARDAETVKACRRRSASLKDEAMALWTRGIKARPTVPEVHGSDPYTEDLGPVERRLAEAVRLKDISPRPHNNLGRVLLRRSQERVNEAAALQAKADEAEANVHAAEANGKTNPAEAAKVRQLKAEAETARREANARIPDLKKQAKEKLDQAIYQFERAVQLDPSLLEARLNLGEVYTQLANYDKATAHYLKILDLDNPSVVEKDAIANFSQAYFGLARIAFAKNKPDEGFAELKQSIAKNSSNMAALERLARELFLRDKYHDGEHVLCLWFSKMPPVARPSQVQRFAAQLANEGKQPQALRALGFAAWIFATSPEPKLRNPQEAGKVAEQIVRLSKQQDPLALDTFAAAAAVNGRFDIAVRAAQDAIRLATAQGDKALADMISRRLLSYQNHKPYLSDPNGRDRP